MSNIKKFSAIALSITTAMWLMAGVFMPTVSAQTSTDLQAQISALLAQIQALQGQLSTTQGSSSAILCAFTATLKLGSKGDAVKCLQQYLNGAGYTVATSGVGSVGNESTYFGSKTKAAVAAWQAANSLPSTGLFGSMSRAKYASLATTTTTTTTTTDTTTTTTTTTGLTLALASDNPGSQTVPLGAAGITALKFTVSGKGTLQSLTFKRLGVGSTGDFPSSGFYLYEGSTRLTSGRSINSTNNEISFLNLGLAIDGTKTLSLLIDIDTDTAGNFNYFTLTSAAGDPTPTGTLTGNPITWGSSQVGTVTATSSGSVANPSIGKLGALLAEFKLTAGSAEDIKINQLALTEAGTITNSYLSNFILKQSGTEVAKASAVGSKDLVTFVFATPYTLEKGQERVFQVYGDISGQARSGDTIIFYFDSKSDVQAIGQLYGFPVNPTITGLDTSSEGQTLTVSGGAVTVTFNGPITGDIALRAQDVEVYNFTIASANNIEIKNLRFTASTSGSLINGEGFPDMKVWDTSNNSVITSAFDVTSSTTSYVYTDVINISAGASKTYKVTVDVDSDNDDGDDIKVSLAAFSLGDIKNLDNNQNVALADIVPSGSSAVAGNTLTTRVATLDVQLSSTPSSQTIVRGTNLVSLAGFSFRAQNSDIKVSSVKITATSSSGTLTSGELQNLGLYDGATLVSTLKSLDTSALTATFDSLSITIPKGSTKILTVKGNIAADATNGDVYFVNIAAVNSTNITATDPAGNSVSLTPSGTQINTNTGVVVTLTTSGDVSVVKAADDSESESGIVIAGSEQVLAKFRFTATNENMTVNKMRLLVVPTNSAVDTSSAAADEVSMVKLYDGSTQIGSAAGYSVTGSGDNSGTVFIDSLGWVIPKDGSKTLTVKGVLNSISGGADSGASVYASIMASGFEAQGSTALDTALTAATGNQMVAYKTKPTFATPTAASSKLTVGQIPVIKFKIKADGPEQVAWKQIQFKVSMTGASITLVDAVPGTTGNVTIKRVGASSNLNIASAFSSTSTSTGEQAAITGGNTGYVSLLLSSEDTIAAGAEQEYEVALTFNNVSGTVGAASIVANLHRTETTLVSASTVSAVRSSILTATDAAPSFVWSDYSQTSHSETTADWANGVLVKILPSSSITISN